MKNIDNFEKQTVEAPLEQITELQKAYEEVMRGTSIVEDNVFNNPYVYKN